MRNLPMKACILAASFLFNTKKNDYGYCKSY
jgi:hypothetical protein